MREGLKEARKDIVGNKKLLFKFNKNNHGSDLFYHDIIVSSNIKDNKFTVEPGTAHGINKPDSESYCVYSIEYTKDDVMKLHLRIPSYSLFAANETADDTSAYSKAVEIWKIYDKYVPIKFSMVEFNELLAENIIIKE